MFSSIPKELQKSLSYVDTRKCFNKLLNREKKKSSFNKSFNNILALMELLLKFIDISKSRLSSLCIFYNT